MSRTSSFPFLCGDNAMAVWMEQDDASNFRLPLRFREPLVVTEVSFLIFFLLALFAFAGKYDDRWLNAWLIWVATSGAMIGYFMESEFTIGLRARRCSASISILLEVFRKDNKGHRKDNKDEMPQQRETTEKTKEMKKIEKFKAANAQKTVNI